MDLRWWHRWWQTSIASDQPVRDELSIDREAVVGVIKANDFNDHAGTPESPRVGWLGIRLNAPRRIVVKPRPRDPLFGDDAPIVLIWGHCLLPDSPSDHGGDHRERIIIVAVDVAQRRVFSGRVICRPPIGSVHVPDLRPEPGPPTPGSASGGPFNPDLIGICGIPLTDADYEIFAMMGEWRSNIIDVQVRFALGQ